MDNITEEYIGTLLNEEFPVKQIYTVHYFEFARDYIFEGEKHDFWEFLYVDKGEVEVMADTAGFKLRQGEMIFHKPNEFHNVWANGRVAPNLIVIAFDCRAEAMKYFENKIISIGDVEKNLLAQIIRESMEAFSSPLNLSSLKRLERRRDSLPGSEQLIKIYIEQMLVFLARKGTSIRTESRLSSAAKERSDNDLFNKVTGYMKDNINRNILFENICSYCSMSRTNLKSLFREKADSGVMEYFKKMKIEEAKVMIREEKYNITEIALLLGYTSIHYFSRHFKRVTDMSPSEYASSVKVKI